MFSTYKINLTFNNNLLIFLFFSAITTKGDIGLAKKLTSDAWHHSHEILSIFFISLTGKDKYEIHNLAFNNFYATDKNCFEVIFFSLWRKYQNKYPKIKCPNHEFDLLINSKVDTFHPSL